MPSSSFRFYVQTPDQYKQLENGNISRYYHSIAVEASAHPNVLSLPKKYANALWLGLYFVDGLNKIHIFPQWQHAWAQFSTKSNVMHYIPYNYSSYEIRYDDEVPATSSEIDYLLTWNFATSLIIMGSSNVAYELSHRIKEGSFPNLNKLDLTLQPALYREVDTLGLLKHLNSLKHLSFRAPSLTYTQLNEFTINQQVPVGWKLVTRGKRIEFRKEWPFEFFEDKMLK